ncbi:MAG: GTPase [Candidatus Bathyarchaeia archaeon]
MPTNLPPQCRSLERRYLEAETLPEKIKALKEYHAAIPKHKGTERLRAQIKRKLSKLRLEMEERKRRRATISLASGRYSIKKEGAAQVVVLGPTNSGKSSLLRALTNAKPEINSHPFTTTEPIPGMTPFEDIQIQLVEAPALFEGAGEGKGWGLRTLSLARNADGLILLVDLSTGEPCAQLDMMMDELNGARIRVGERGSRVEVERRDGGGVQFICSGRFLGEMDEIRRFLMENGIANAVVRIWGEVDLDEVALSLVSGVAYKPAIVVANKIDIDGAELGLETLRKRFGDRFEVMGGSAKTGMGLDGIPRGIFGALNIVRIYTKRPRQRPSRRPLIMRGETTVEDVAKAVHSEFYRNFKYARVWGSSRYPGERVGLRYLLKDGDTVEIRA